MENKTVYKDIRFKETILSDLVGKSNRIFKSLYTCKFCFKERTQILFPWFQKATNLGRLYLLPKIYGQLSNVPGRPGTSNCGTPKKKASEFLDFHLKPLMQSS